uniref:Polyprotein n=1 Tax=Cajanus cajan TaxID=3821 RepID=A0A151SJ10_CAJCA|nr:polyprotein [Cajanus cajan]
MEQCSLMATSEEQYVTIEIPKELIRHWRTDGYTHLHYGAIRLMLTLHGRRGLHVSSRISLLDTSYLHYENVVIGTVLTTLHAGSVVLTLFPNYNVSLRDPTVPERLKVQVQITGAAQTADAVCATLHYQIIYRLQTHAVNLALPSSNDSALEQLKELIPLQWVTNYENLHKHHGKPIQTDQATFRRSVDGTVRTIFQQPETASGPIFQTMMLEPFVKEKRIPIFAVHADGREIYTDRINGHFIWDVAPEMCDPECDCWMHSGDTSEEEDSESDKFPPLERKINPSTRYSTKPTIIPSEIGTDGKPKVLSQAEEVLNWQTENAQAQNSLLKKIDDKVTKMSSSMQKSEDKLDYLSSKMKSYYQKLTADISRLENEIKNIPFGAALNEKDREIRSLKAQLFQLEEQIEQKKKALQPQPVAADPYAFLHPPAPVSHSLFKTSSVSWSKPERPHYNIPTASANWQWRKSQSSSQKISKSIEDDSKSSTPVSSPKRHDTGKGHYFQDSQDPYSQMMIKENEQLATPESSVNTGSEDDLLTNLSDEDSITTASSEAQLADLSVLMVSTGPDPIYESPDESPIQSPRNRTTKPTRGPWFTLDDVDPSQWRSRLIEFGAWLDTRFMKGDTESYKIIEEFGCRMTGILKEWYANLGPVGQNTFHELGNAAAVLGALHEEFIGDGALTDRKIRQEFFEMKCCSLKLKDLDKHYLRMLKRFYLLNGLNDPSLKSTYVSSLPTEIQPELARMAAAMNKDFTGLTIGRIHQMTQEAIDKLCRQHEYFSNMLKDKGKYVKACRKPFLEIKCKDKDRCHCSKKKFKGKKFPSHFKKKKYKKPYRFFKKREIRGKNPGQRCYICGKRGHFAKTCPNKAQKAIKMITSLHLNDRDEVESLYSEQSSADEDTVFALQDSFSDTSSSDADDYSQDEDTVPIFVVDQCDSMTIVVPPHPNVEIEILPSKYEKPIKAIGFLDTGEILP